MGKNRSHSSISKALSTTDKEAFHRRLATPGITYDDVVGWLNERGYQISRSAVGRYGKDFMARLENLKVVEEKAKAIVSEVGDALAMEEAAAKIFTQKVLEHLLQIDDLSGQKFGSLMAAFAKLQASSATRERLKADVDKKASKAAGEVKKLVEKGGLSKDAVEAIEREILGIVR